MTWLRNNRINQLTSRPTNRPTNLTHRGRGGTPVGPQDPPGKGGHQDQGSPIPGKRHPQRLHGSIADDTGGASALALVAHCGRIEAGPLLEGGTIIPATETEGTEPPGAAIGAAHIIGESPCVPRPATAALPHPFAGEGELMGLPPTPRLASPPPKTPEVEGPAITC